MEKILKLNSNRNRLFFCINSGRSGSKYLAELLGSAKEVISYHEANPTMTGKYLQMINESSYAETFHKRLMKSKKIKKILRGLQPEQVYCETNHMFIKTFYDVIMSEFKYVEIIILRRNIALVLKSFIELNYFSSSNKGWHNWMSIPQAKTAAIPCIALYEEMDQYDLCIAYLIDIEARSQRFKQEFSSEKIHEVRLEALNEYKNIDKLFHDLRITPTNKTKAIYGQAINPREKKKIKFNNPTDLEYCKKRISDYIKKAKLMEISLPDSLDLDHLQD